MAISTMEDDDCTVREVNSKLRRLKKEFGSVLKFSIYYDLYYYGNGKFVYDEVGYNKLIEVIERWGYLWDTDYRDIKRNSGDQDIAWGKIERAFLSDYMKLPRVVQFAKKIKAWDDLGFQLRMELYEEGGNIVEIVTLPGYLFNKKGIWRG